MHANAFGFESFRGAISISMDCLARSDISTHTATEIVTKLRQAERLLGEGASVAQICKQLGVSEHTYYRWRQQYGGMAVSEAKWLKELEQENTKLKRIVAQQVMDLDALKELLKKNSKDRPPSAQYTPPSGFCH